MPLDPAAITWAVEAFTLNTEAYTKSRNYYHGKQELAFATDKYNRAFGSLFRAYAYNRCRPVVDAMANRLKVKGFQVNGVDLASLTVNELGTTAGATAATQALTPSGPDYATQALTLWKLGAMDKREGEIYVEAGITGDAYGVVYFDAPPPYGTGLPRIWPNRADVMRVRYDDDGRRLMAAKSWLVTQGPDAKKRRLTIYTPNEIYKLITTGTAEAELPKEAAQYTLYKTVNPLGQAEVNPIVHNLGIVPVVHYPNNAPMQGDFGISELADVLPLQDAINKAGTDMLVAMEFSAYRQRYAIGIDQPAIDPETGKPIIPFQPGPGELWYTTGEKAQFGSFEASDLKQFLEVKNGYDLDIARVSATPVHWLIMTGTPPSGESIKTAEAPFASKLEDRQRSHGAAHAEAMAIKFQLMGIKDPLMIETQWQPAQSRSEREQVEMGKMMVDAGVPLIIAAKVMGLDEQDLLALEAAEAEKEAAREQAMAQLSGMAMQGSIEQRQQEQGFSE